MYPDLGPKILDITWLVKVYHNSPIEIHDISEHCGIKGLEFLASVICLPNELMALSIDVKSNDKKMRNPKRAKMDPTIN